MNFFNTDLNKRRKANSLEEYLACFEEGKGKVCGEGSPSYLYSKDAPKNIYNFNPDAKIIIILREPVSMMYAYHAQHLSNGSSETVQSFEEALNLESVRKKGQEIPPRCREPQILYYRDFASYADQVKRYLETFKAEQVKIIIFDDFKSDTQQVFQEVLEFLGVDPTYKTTLGPRNRNTRVRNTFLQTLIKYPPSKVLELGKYFFPIPQAQRRAFLEYVKSKLKKMNTERAPRPPLDPQLRNRLVQEFKPEIKRLETVINRDLSMWYS